MIIFSIGLPSGFTSRCDALLLDLARRAWGGVEFIAADNLEDVALQMLGSPAANFVVCTRRPSARMRDGLRDRNCRFILSLGDPVSVVADMLAAGGASVLSAVRDVATSVATVTRYAALPGALILDDGGGEAYSDLDIARAVDRHLEFQLDEADIAAAAAAFGPVGHGGQVDVGSWWNGLASDDRGLISGALEGLRDYAVTGTARQLNWERALFSPSDKPGQPAVEAVDVTGRARCLFYGPYIALAPASWTAHVVLACSNELAGMSFFIEVTVGPSSLAGTHLTPERGGVFEAVLDFVIDDAMEGVVEVRVFSERAAFDGLLGLGRVVLVPRLPITGNHRGNVAEELGIHVD